MINPVAALKKLDSPGYAVTKRFLQQTPVDPKVPGGMNMYQKTVDTLEKMIPEGMTVQQRMIWYAELHHAGDPRGKLYDFTMPYTPRPAPVPMRPPLPEEYMTQVPPKGGAPQQPVPEKIPELTRHDYAPAPPAPIPQPVPEPIPNLNEALLARVPEKPPSWAEQLQKGAIPSPGRVVGSQMTPARTGPLPPIRQGVVAAGAQYAPAIGLGTAGFFVNKAFPGVIPGGQYGAMGVGTALGLGTKQILASILMKPKSQDLLVKLIESRGLRLDPVMTGILNAAVRQGVTYGLPQEAPAVP